MSSQVKTGGINQIISNIYNNTFKFYDYRGYISLDKKTNPEDICAKIYKDKYLILKSVNKKVLEEYKISIDELSDYIENFNEKTKDKNIYITYILLIYIDTDVESKRANMIKMLNHIRYPKAETLIITPNKLSSSITKYLLELPNMNEHKYRTFKPYTYNLLKTILPEFELVPKYKILNETEIKDLEDHYINKDLLSKVFDNDPQMVWLGANVGDVIMFTYPSEITIKTIGYCVVIPGPNYF